MAFDLLDLPPTSRLTINQYYFKIDRTFEDRYELISSEGYQIQRTMPRIDVPTLVKIGDLEVDPFYFDVDGNPARPDSGVKLLAAYPTDEIRDALIKNKICQIFYREWRAGLVSLATRKPRVKGTRRRRASMALPVDVWWEQNQLRLLEAIKPFLVLGAEGPANLPKRGRFRFSGFSLGTAPSFKKDFEKFRSAGFALTDFIRNVDAMRRGGRKLDPEMRAFCLKEIRSVLLSPERMSLSLFRRYLTALLKHHPGRLKDKAPPTHQALERLILTLNHSLLIAARFGLKEMIDKANMWGDGPDFRRVGQMVIQDCWKVDLMVLMNDVGDWMVAPHDGGEENSLRRRIWASVVIDAFSRVILGFAFGLTESAALNRQALRMAVSDKTLYAQRAGCKAPPVPPIGIEAILTDVGTSFQGADFFVPALTLTRNTNIGPADAPWLRGLKERFFRTVKEQLLVFFSGYTFGNIVARGDYPAEERASLEMSELGNEFFLYVNDVYNISGHSGIDGQVPIERFKQGFNVLGGADVCTRDEVRLIFGVDLLLPLTRQGICFAANQYRSAELATFLGSRGPQKQMRAKVDPVDLGRISVFFEGAWHTLFAPRCMVGVGLTDWCIECNALERRYAAEAAVYEDIVADALLRLQRKGAEARLRARIRDLNYDNYAVAGAARRLKLRVRENGSPTTDRELLAYDSSSIEGAAEATGVDPDYIEVFIDPDAQEVPPDRYADDADPEGVDIDGDPLLPTVTNATADADRLPVKPASQEKPVRKKGPSKEKPTKPATALAPVKFLPTPKGKDNRK